MVRTHLLAHVNGAFVFNYSYSSLTPRVSPISLSLILLCFLVSVGAGLVYVTMAIVFHLPSRTYQFLALQIVVYWAIVAGHMASGFSPLIGIPLLPLLVVQIILLIHIWTNLVTKHQSPSDASSAL